MTHRAIYHALGLHMHQPPGNLKLLIDSNEWEAEQIVRCYERAARYAHRYADEARLHVGFSGVLLEQFRDPEIVDRYRRFVDIPAMLELYREARNIELIGMGYYHPIFPLIPVRDWEEQLAGGRQIMDELFGRTPRGFWPPEMAFSMEMIPALVKAGYDYVVVDGVHVRPEDDVDDIYRPYCACYDGACITVVPRDRDLSNAQESGLDPTWFANETLDRVRHSPRPDEPRLVTTWSDGENGGWFRQTHEESGFFGYFLAPYMEHLRSGDYPVTPVSISRFLETNPPATRALVQTGAWNVGSTSGYDFTQWIGTDSQRRALDVLTRTSDRYWSLARDVEAMPAVARVSLEQARALILEAETSCFLFWGESWIPQLYERTGPAEQALDRVDAVLRETAGPDLDEPEGAGRAAEADEPSGTPRAPRDERTQPVREEAAVPGPESPLATDRTTDPLEEPASAPTPSAGPVRKSGAGERRQKTVVRKPSGRKGPRRRKR